MGELSKMFSHTVSLGRRGGVIISWYMVVIPRNTHYKSINQSIKYQWICTIQSISHQIITNSRQMFASSMIFWRITNLIQIFSTLWWMWYLYWIHSAYLKYDSCTPACWSRPILRPFTTSITGLSTRIVLKFHSWEVTMIHQWICCFLTEKDESVGRNLKTIYLWSQH